MSPYCPVCKRPMAIYCGDRDGRINDACYMFFKSESLYVCHIFYTPDAHFVLVDKSGKIYYYDASTQDEDGILVSLKNI